MQFLLIADPMKDLKPATDTSLGFARDALIRGYTVHHCTTEDIFFWHGRVHARVENLVDCREGGLPSTELIKEPLALNEYDGVWVRKDPPFDQNYLNLCWLLALEESNVPMVNKPSLLLRYHEKMLPWEALDRGFLSPDEVVPTYVPGGRRLPVPKDFPRGECVMKPWLGHGGKGVKKVPSPQSPEPWEILQPLLPEVMETGDRRVFILDGTVIGSFTRIPPPGEIKSNIASGGTGIIRPMTPTEERVADNVASFLKEIGIVFAGVDMIGGRVTEINITSPTGLLTYRQIGGPGLTGKFIDYVETLI